MSKKQEEVTLPFNNVFQTLFRDRQKESSNRRV